MPLAFSNKVNLTGTQTSTPALSSALNSKINPQPLQLPPNKYSSFTDQQWLDYQKNKAANLAKAQTAPTPVTFSFPSTPTLPQTNNNLGLLNNIKNTATSIQSGINSLANGSPNNPPSYNIGTPVAGQTQGQANTQANLPSYQGGQQISGTGGPTYQGTVGQLINTAQNNPTSGIVQSLIGKATSPQWQTINGVQYNTADPNFDPVTQANKNLQEFQTKYAQQQADISGLPLGVSEQTGRGQIMAQQAAATQGALQQEAANALELRNQNLNALGTAGGIANTAQGQQLGALGTAAGFGQPQLGAYGQTYYNPLSNTQSGSTGVQPSDPFYQTMQTYAQLLASNQGGAIPTSITGNPVLNAQVQQMAKALNPNFNNNTSAGIAGAQQFNAQTGGTAGVQANQAVLNPAYADYLQLQQTTQNIDQFGGLLTQTMQQGGINPFDVKFANKTLGEIRNQLSSGQQAIYDNTLATLRSRVSGLLAAGGKEIPSAITSDAQKILDGSLPLSSLNGVLQRIQQEGQILLTNAAGVVNTAYTGVQGGNTQQQNNAGAINAGGYTFVKDAKGNWVAK